LKNDLQNICYIRYQIGHNSHSIGNMQHCKM